MPRPLECLLTCSVGPRLVEGDNRYFARSILPNQLLTNQARLSLNRDHENLWGHSKDRGLTSWLHCVEMRHQYGRLEIQQTCATIKLYIGTMYGGLAMDPPSITVFQVCLSGVGI